MKKENKLKTTYKFIIEKREKGKKDEDLGVIKAEGFRFKIKDLETNKFIKAGRKPDSNYKEDVEEFVTQKNGETEEYYLKEDGNGGSYKPQNRYEIIEVATPKNSPFANDSKPQRLTPKRMDSSGKAKHRIFDSRLKKNAKKKITKPTKGDAVSSSNKAPKTGRFTGISLRQSAVSSSRSCSSPQFPQNSISSGASLLASPLIIASTAYECVM